MKKQAVHLKESKDEHTDGIGGWKEGRCGGIHAALAPEANVGRQEMGTS